MADTNSGVHNKSDELDLIALAEKFSFFIRDFGKLILAYTVIGLLVAGGLFMLLQKQYSSRLILHSVILTNQEEIEIIQTWRELLKKKEYATLARIMNSDEKTLRKLSRISSDEIQKLYIQNNPNGFVVNVLVKDTGILDELQRGIVHGLEASEYVSARVALKKANLIEMIEKVKIEITKLDSTKANVENIINNKNRSSPGLMIDVSGINSQLIGLNEKLLGFQEGLRFVNAVQVLQGFSKLSKPDEPKLVKTLFLGGIIGLFIGYMVSLVKSVRRKLKLRAIARSQAL